MADLFAWCKSTDVHPLILSSVFHFELEFIHPFVDGNGRIGRLWQTLLLSRWEPLFLWIPIETMILEKQEEYYQGLNMDGPQAYFFEVLLLPTHRMVQISLKTIVFKKNIHEFHVFFPNIFVLSLYKQYRYKLCNKPYVNLFLISAY